MRGILRTIVYRNYNRLQSKATSIHKKGSVAITFWFLNWIR